MSHDLAGPEQPVFLILGRLVCLITDRKKKQWKLVKQGVEVDKYRETEKKVRNMIRNAKRNFEKRLAKGGEDGQAKKQFYSYVKTKTKSRVGVGPLKDEAGSTVSGDREMADLLNKFFASVFTSSVAEPVLF